MTRTIRFNGTKYTTASGCRFVIFGHAAADGAAYIYKRSNSVDTAKKHRTHARNGLIVDFVGGSVYGVSTGFKWEAVAS